MWGFLHFLQRTYHYLLFIVLQVTAFMLLVSKNPYQRAEFLSTGVAISGGLYSFTSTFTQAFVYKDANEKLAAENVMLKNMLAGKTKLNLPSFPYSDTLELATYRYSYAKVVNNSVNKLGNAITLNKGLAQGMRVGLGVVSSHGVVGVIKGVSSNYSVVLPIINSQMRISSKLKHTGYFGSLYWDGRDYRKAHLEGIEHYVQISVGDTVVTSGYGTIFPEGMLIGTVDKLDLSADGAFYDIVVNLSTNYKKLSYVEVISNINAGEQAKTEGEQTTNE